MRVIFACLVFLSMAAEAALCQSPQSKGDLPPWRSVAVNVDTTYFGYRHMKLKSLSLQFADPPLTAPGAPVLGRLVYLLEFERDIWDYDLDSLQKEFIPMNKRLRHIFFDGDNVALNPFRIYDYRIQGEISGIKGEAFRVSVEFPLEPSILVSDIKKLVIRPW